MSCELIFTPVPKGSCVVPCARRLTIGGITYDLSDDRTWVSAGGGGVESINGSDGALIWTTLSDYSITDAYPLTGNPSGFLVSSDLSPYLTSSLAASTYYLQTNPLGYITSSALSGYLTSSVAASTYVALTGSYSDPTWITSLASGTGVVKSTAGTISYISIKGSIDGTFNGGGGVIANGSSFVIIPDYSGTITGWYLASISGTALLSGSATIAITKNSVDIINAGIAPSLSTQSSNSGTTMTSWTTSFVAGDIIIVTANSITTCQQLYIKLSTTHS